MIARCAPCAGRGVYPRHYFGRLTLEHCRTCRGTGFVERYRRETELRCRRLAREADRLVAEDAER
jgi:DnaJ-class molecular chaperone